ncbi:hypothetical protein HZS_7104 [Henneguya salminicola]|nr:hypothetical protein HZS_7104 [Henneguya salminicola]
MRQLGIPEYRHYSLGITFEIDEAKFRGISSRDHPVNEAWNWIYDNPGLFRRYYCYPGIYTHLTVNHSVEFVDSFKMTRTNTIDNARDDIKTRISSRNLTYLYDNGKEENQDEIKDHLVNFKVDE